MEFQKLIETRRTVRKYAADSKVTREQMEALIRAAQEAPSWKNSNRSRRNANPPPLRNGNRNDERGKAETGGAGEFPGFPGGAGPD